MSVFTSIKMRTAFALISLIQIGYVTAATDELSVSYTANAGVILSSGSSSVLIDSFFSRTFGRFHALDREEHKTLYSRQIPLALATHIHGDHFSSGPVIGFLNANSNTLFASSEQVTKQLIGKVKDRQLVSAKLNRAETMELEHNGMIITMLNMPHGTGEFAAIHNYAQLVDINGWKVLHVGDAAIDIENTTKLGFEERDIDIAIVPYWYLFSEGGDEQMALIGADEWIFVHMPPDDIERFDQALARKRSDAKTLSIENKRVKFSR
jgi:L-ascorbate metabolism protein UlaG (beta-lactamase superfamily)